MRFPPALTFSMFIATVSLAVMLLGHLVQSPVDSELHPAQHFLCVAPFIAHWAAGLCFGWSIVASIVARGRSYEAIPPSTRDKVAVLNVAVTVCALGAGIIMLYVAGIEVLLRTLFFNFDETWGVIDSKSVWNYGLIDLGVISSALLLSWSHSRHHHLPTMLFWVLVFACLWSSLIFPASLKITWVIAFMLSSSVVLTLFTIASGYIRHHRRTSAWPDRLDQLLAPADPWPGFRYSAGVVSALILIIGCLLVYHPTTIVSALLAGIASLVLASRRWEANLADAGLALMTLAVTSAFMLFIPQLVLDSPHAFFAEVLNRAVIALAIMVWIWYGLASVWKQQLDQGRAWTTTGRMIRVTERVGYILAATALFLGVWLAIWPKLKFVYIPDNQTTRWIEGSIAYLLLIGALGTSAKRTGKTTLAWCTLFALAPPIAFYLVRASHHPISQAWSNYWPLVLTGFAWLCLLLAYLAAKSATRKVFAEPFMVSSVFILPVVAAMGIASTNQMSMPTWLPVATFGSLAVHYIVASFKPGPRLFMVMAMFCASLALWYSWSRLGFFWQ